MQKEKACEITALIAKTLHEMQLNPNKKSIKYPKKQPVSTEIRVHH